MHQNKILVFAFLLLLCACEKRNLNQHDPQPKKPVLYQLDGKRYSVPLGYHWDAYTKYKKWPDPKKDYTTVGYIAFTALLPNLDQVTELNAREFATNRLGRKVSVLMTSSASRPRPLSEIRSDLADQGQLVKLEDSIEGLSHFADKQQSQSPDQWRDMYFDSNSDADFWIECVRGVPFPSCVVVHSEPGLPFIKYRYERQHLGEWKVIDRKVMSLLNSFQEKDNYFKAAIKKENVMPVAY